MLFIPLAPRFQILLVIDQQEKKKIPFKFSTALLEIRVNERVLYKFSIHLPWRTACYAITWVSYKPHCCVGALYNSHDINSLSCMKTIPNTVQSSLLSFHFCLWKFFGYRYFCFLLGQISVLSVLTIFF